MLAWFRKLAPVFQGFLGALLAILFVLFWLRAYEDDQTLRAIVAMINSNSAQRTAPVAPPVQNVPQK